MSPTAPKSSIVATAADKYVTMGLTACRKETLTSVTITVLGTLTPTIGSKVSGKTQEDRSDLTNSEL